MPYCLYSISISLLPNSYSPYKMSLWANIYAHNSVCWMQLYPKCPNVQTLTFKTSPFLSGVLYYFSKCCCILLYIYASWVLKRKGSFYIALLVCNIFMWQYFNYFNLFIQTRLLVVGWLHYNWGWNEFLSTCTHQMSIPAKGLESLAHYWRIVTSSTTYLRPRTELGLLHISQVYHLIWIYTPV